MLVSYPAFFYYDTEYGGYSVHFPDFKHSATQGEDISEALMMGSEYLGITIADYLENGETLPKASNINELSLIDDSPFKDNPDIDMTSGLDQSFISMVVTDVSQYMNMDQPVTKTVTIPLWADELGKKLGLDYSQTLTDAISEKGMF